MLEAMQMLSSFCQPIFNPHNVRHQSKEEKEGQDSEGLDQRLFYYDVLMTVSESAIPAMPSYDGGERKGVVFDSNQKERCGTTHLVHLWEAQGHLGTLFSMAPSVDMVGRSAQQALAVKWYFHATEEIALCLAGLFSQCFPNYYKKYRAAFDVGIRTLADPGPWLG
ncbi:hypothetical protein AZE42_13507 [Rhizopogon vesiculosus]|uniref:Uncharacterized protein n=1 Tax=Rhizopogon vesiculosus TaxID=180088 RepID=A0A1J8QIJ8_9AGAM|nr:hypothetical protein AZE42_13507 [Rhizopogon vesiculosus]